MPKYPRRKKPTAAAEIAKLKKRIARLEDDTDFLSAKIGRVIAHFSRQGIALCEVSDDIVTELRLIQNKLFPGIETDLRRAEKIVPFNDTSSPDELDRRSKKAGKEAPKEVK